MKVAIKKCFGELKVKVVLWQVFRFFFQAIFCFSDTVAAQRVGAQVLYPALRALIEQYLEEFNHAFGIDACVSQNADTYTVRFGAGSDMAQEQGADDYPFAVQVAEKLGVDLRLATDAEIEQNRRARSAHLRIAERT